MYQLSDYHFELPQELIAQQPSQQRDQSRLMVVEKNSGKIWEMPFHELTDYLNEGDSLVLNNTKVIPARLVGQRANGSPAEIFLLKHKEGTTWETMAKPGKKIKAGAQLIFGSLLSCRVVETLHSGNKLVEFDCSAEDFENILQKVGTMPLPPYIQRDQPNPCDQKNYQTVFAEKAGAVAAPTAGLHFTPEMLDTLKGKGVEQIKITLHVGLGTFRPVFAKDIREHRMHAESYQINTEAAKKLNREGRKICVGTTCCRTLESAVDAEGKIAPQHGDTDIFIYPGYQFRYVDSLLTNFHLPGSSLLMLVSALAGKELVFEAYHKAIEKGFRFFSYGDAMLVV
ncbi:MAG: tRNA preQ1(34) S-adenosylmethionine ribosyltransferase-isomerase QueA [Chlamydiota bacterium]